VRLPGCTGGGEDSIFAHFADRHYGRSQKASDTSGGDCCMWCHDRMDRRAKMIDGTLISEADYDFYARRAIAETIEDRIERGILKLPDFTP
jgi:hypothetical protein